MMPSLSPSSAAAASAAANVAVAADAPSGGRDMHVSTRPRSVGHAAGQCAVRAMLAVLACADHRAPRFEPGRGAMAARAATAAAATRAGRALRVERAGRRGHGPMRARRAWAAASMPQSRAKYARRRRVLRRAAAAYGVVYLAFYSARDVQTLTNQRGTQRLTMVHRWVLSTRQFGIVFSCVPRPVEIAISRPRLTFVPRVLFTGTLHFMEAALGSRRH